MDVFQMIRHERSRPLVFCAAIYSPLAVRALVGRLGMIFPQGEKLQPRDFYGPISAIKCRHAREVRACARIARGHVGHQERTLSPLRRLPLRLCTEPVNFFPQILRIYICHSSVCFSCVKEYFTTLFSQFMKNTFDRLCTS